MSTEAALATTPELGNAAPVSVAEAEERLALLTGVMNRASAQLVGTVAAAMAAGSDWLGWGYSSPEHWLRVRAGLSSARARSVVAAARRHDDLPVTMRMFEEGRLTLEQVSVIVAHVPAAYEASVADLAPYATVDQLRRATKDYPFPAEDGVGDAGTAGAEDVSGDPASLSMRYLPRGRFELRFEGPAHEGAIIENAVTEIKDALWRHLNAHAGEGRNDLGASEAAEGGHGCTPRTAGRFAHVGDDVDACGPGGAVAGAVVGHAVSPGSGGGGADADADATCVPVSTARAFVELAASSLAALSSRSAESMFAGESRRDRYRVWVHLDTDGAWLTGRPRLSRHVTEALTCDGTLQPVWHTQGRPVNVGRAQRIVPERTRRLLADRDRGCRFPGCGVRVGVESHHIVHWADGGLTDTPNLVSLCSHHHDAHHRGEFTITGDADAPDGHPAALRFTHRGGWRIGYTPPPARRSSAAFETSLAESRRAADTPGVPPIYTPPTGEVLHTRLVTFTAGG